MTGIARVRRAVGGSIVQGYAALPRAARRPVEVLRDALPTGWQAALATSLPGVGAAVPDPVVAPSAPLRLYVGPANYAGQGTRWARSVDDNLPGVRAVSMATVSHGGFAYPADYLVAQDVYSGSATWAHTQRKAVRQGFSHVVIEAGRPLFPRVGDGSAFTEARDLTSHGIAVAMLCHGSDIRLPSRHAASSRWSPFREEDWKDVSALEEQARRNRAGLEALGFPVFVATPDLLLDVPEATWIPIAIDPSIWETEGAPLERRVPIVVHAPTHPVIKGTALVEPMLRDLHARGLIDYRQVTGVTSKEMPALYGGADIVLDQFRIGNYATAACEAMAAGRVVVAHVDDQVRGHVREVTGREVPVVEATPDTLESVILAILEDREGARQVAARGPAFVRELHDGRASARALSGFLGVGSATEAATP